jgi:hypothetical protein
VLGFPAESVTVMVMLFVPVPSGIVAVQVVVPLAVPLPPVRAFDQVTWETPPGSDAVPVTVRGDDAAVPDVGPLTVTVGGVVSVPPPPVVYVISSAGWYATVAYSLLAHRKLMFVVEKNFIPKLLVGLVSQPWTSCPSPVMT